MITEIDLPNDDGRHVTVLSGLTARQTAGSHIGDELSDGSPVHVIVPDR